MKIKIGLTFEYDPKENDNIPSNIFLFQMINRLNYEYPVTEVEYKGKKLIVKKIDDIKNIKLKQQDNI